MDICLTCRARVASLCYLLRVCSISLMRIFTDARAYQLYRFIIRPCAHPRPVCACIWCRPWGDNLRLSVAIYMPEFYEVTKSSRHPRIIYRHYQSTQGCVLCMYISTYILCACIYVFMNCYEKFSWQIFTSFLSLSSC